MKIVLTHGYFIQEDEKEQKIMRPYPPLGILYISAWLEKHGFDNDVFDSTFSSREKLYNYLLAEKPDIIPIYTNLMTKINVIEMVKFIKSQDKLKHSIVVLGGPDVTYNVEKYLQTGTDIVVIGEGEQTMLEIAQAIQQGNRADFHHITGIAYRAVDGSIIKNVPRKRIRPVDDLPMPNRKKIKLELYLQAWKKRHGKSTISISTQRGCPYTCQWCSTAVYGQSYRRRSPKSVVDEMLYLRETYNPDSLWFVDDVFTVSHKWLAAFSEEVNQRQAVIPFECITRADRMDDQVIQTLKAAGAFRVWIGAESGSQKIIDAMDRRVEVGQVREMIQKSKQAGIQTGTFIMLGYPGETVGDIEQTIDHLISSDPDLFTITVAYPIKGTGLFEKVAHLQTKELDWDTTTDRDREFTRTYPRKFYDHAVRRVVNKVHYHKQRANHSIVNIPALKYKIKYELATVGMWWQKRGVHE